MEVNPPSQVTSGPLLSSDDPWDFNLFCSETLTPAHPLAPESNIVWGPDQYDQHCCCTQLYPVYFDELYQRTACQKCNGQVDCPWFNSEYV